MLACRWKRPWSVWGGGGVVRGLYLATPTASISPASTRSAPSRSDPATQRLSDPAAPSRGDPTAHRNTEPSPAPSSNPQPTRSRRCFDPVRPPAARLQPAPPIACAARKLDLHVAMPRPRCRVALPFSLCPSRASPGLLGRPHEAAMLSGLRPAPRMRTRQTCPPQE